MLTKPILEDKTLEQNDNMNLVNEQIVKQICIKNEEESLKKEDLTKLVDSTIKKSEDEMKNSEAQTKQTNTEENHLFSFQYNNLMNLPLPNYLLLPNNLIFPGILIPYEQLKVQQDNKENIAVEPKKRGRKSTNPKPDVPHNKYANDNLRKKSKHIILSEIMTFLNKKLKEIYNGNLGNGLFFKQLLTLNHKQKSNINIRENRDFLNRTLQEIFSQDVSLRFTNYPKDHNKELIKKLLNEEDEEKRIYFNKVFNLTFSQVLLHFQEKTIIEELIGLKTYKEAIKKYEDEKDYYENLVYHLINFKEIIESKKPRKEKSCQDNKKVKIE
jgi:hypothetical protein